MRAAAALSGRHRLDSLVPAAWSQRRGGRATVIDADGQLGGIVLRFASIKPFPLAIKYADRSTSPSSNLAQAVGVCTSFSTLHNPYAPWIVVALGQQINNKQTVTLILRAKDRAASLIVRTSCLSRNNEWNEWTRSLPRHCLQSLSPCPAYS